MRSESKIDMLAYERYYTETAHCEYIAGVDEAGRGPLAGPVCAAAVILPKGLIIEGINDSKKLTERQREKLFDTITEKAVAYCVAWGSVEEIESLNILQATMLTMQRAIEGLSVQPDFVLVDGNRRPETPLPCIAIVKGDAHSQSIAAASILAKVSRDRLMTELAQQYPVYEFDKHKGYGTQLHCEKILAYGPCPIHRASFLTKLLHPEQATQKKRSRTRVVGDRGEDEALQYLLQQGYELVERNYACSYGEVDMIVRDAEYLVFVEVKSRSWDALDRPSAAVDQRKRRKLLQTADHYINEHGLDRIQRMDIVEVVFDPTGRGPSQITHLKGAFGEDSR